MTAEQIIAEIEAFGREGDVMRAVVDTFRELASVAPLALWMSGEDLMAAPHDLDARTCVTLGGDDLAALQCLLGIDTCDDCLDDVDGDDDT